MKTKIKLSINDYYQYLYKIFIIEKNINNKKLFICNKCNYINNRYYHVKMHFFRIHIKNGKPIIKKRKFSKYQ